MKRSRSWIHDSRLILGVVLAMVAMVAACSLTQPTDEPSRPTGDRIFTMSGMMPDWNLEEMVKRSDAVVIGTLGAELGIKIEPGGGNDPPYYNQVYTDYELTVEQTIYPSSGLPAKIAVLVGPNSVPARDNITIIDDGDLPTYVTNEKVLLFLERLDKPHFNEGPGKTPPTDYPKADYYNVVVGNQYGKLTQDGDKWFDGRSSKTITVSDIEDEIEEHK